LCISLWTQEQQVCVQHSCNADESPLFGLFAEELTVLSAAPLPYAPEQDEDVTVWANGIVREVSVAEIERELGWDLDFELQVELEGKETVLIADSVIPHDH
jgi:hypothetical protein